MSAKRKTAALLISIGLLCLLPGCVSVKPGSAPPQIPASKGFYIADGKLYDANRQVFIMRGINHAHTWFTNRLESALTGIKDTGANAVRVVLSNGKRWQKNNTADVKRVIVQCKINRLIAILEVHDTTGYGEEQAHPSTLDEAVDYWIEIRDALDGEEAYVIINIGNEPLGNNMSASWAELHSNAIARLRQAGFTHTIMVDAANWGQDWSRTMLQQAQTVFAADPRANVIFSVHMYDVYNTYAKVDSYLAEFDRKKLPLVIGEFGADHKGAEVDETTILSRAAYYGCGYLGWSWCGNNPETASLDIITGWNPDILSPWGEILVNGTNGIRATAHVCSVFLE